MPEPVRIPTAHSYSAAVNIGDLTFLGLHRGQGDSFAAQLEDLFRRLQDTLSRLDMSLADIVNVHVWLKNIKDLTEMEKQFRRYFEEGKYPARMTSTTEFIDADCLVMIDGIAYRGGPGKQQDAC